MTSNFSLLHLFGISVCLITGTVARVAIIGGNPAKIGEIPYQVSIHVQGKGHRCGGGIIGDEYVLSAAHCVITDEGVIDTTPLSILAGTNDLRKTGNLAVIIPVKKIFVPKQFNVKVVGAPGDISVLQLLHSFELSGSTHHLKALRIPRRNSENFAGKTAVIAGFGFDKVDIKNNNIRGRLSNKLMYAAVDILNYWPQGDQKINLPANLLCGRVKQQNVSKPRGVCNGDSGGPLVHGNIVIGILSIGPNDCAETEMPAVYSRVSYYEDFIIHAVEDKQHDGILTHELR